LFPVCSAGVRRFRPAVALAADQAALVVVARVDAPLLSAEYMAFASAADAVPVELWVTRLRYP